jgi:hypothetical protein
MIMADEVVIDRTCTLPGLATEDTRTFTFSAPTCASSPSILETRNVKQVIAPSGEIYDVETFGEGSLTLEAPGAALAAAPGGSVHLVHLRNPNQITVYNGTVNVNEPGDLVVATSMPMPLSHIPGIVRVVTSAMDVTPDMVSKIVYNDLSAFGVTTLNLVLTGPLPSPPTGTLAQCRVYVKPGFNTGRMVVNASTSFIEQINEQIAENSTGVTTLQDPAAFHNAVGGVTSKVIPMLSISPEAEVDARTFVELYVGQKVFDALASTSSATPHPELGAMFSAPVGSMTSNASSYITSNNSSYQAMITASQARISEKLGGSRSNDDRVNGLLAALDRYKYENMRLGELIRDMQDDGNASRVNTIIYVSIWLAVGILNVAVSFFMPEGRARMFSAMALMVVYLVGFVVAVIYGISKRV